MYGDPFSKLPLKHEPRITRRSRSVPEEVKRVLDLPSVTLPHIEQRRALNYWERVWPLRDRY